MKTNFSSLSSPQSEVSPDDLKNAVIYYAISRQEIEESRIDRLLEDLSPRPNCLLQFCGMGSVVFSVHGYDDDPRELWQIPEFRSFVGKLREIPWIYFSCLESLWLQAIALCVLDHAVTVTNSTTQRTKMVFLSSEVSTFLQAQLPSFFSLCTMRGVSQKDADARLQDVMKSFGFLD